MKLPKFLKFGPEKLKILFNNTKNGTAIVDMLVQPSGFAKFGLKLLTGYKELRIPIQAIPTVKIKRDEVDIPYFEITFAPVLDDETILSSIMGIDNTLNKVKRNKGFTLKLFKKILLKAAVNIEPVKIPIAALQGQTLTMFDYSSNGLGRFNIGLNLSESTMRGRKGWELIWQAIEIIRAKVTSVSAGN
jgi:hypothetical protein